METETHKNQKSPGRPVVLSLLCIITFSFGIIKIIFFSWTAITFLNNSYQDSGFTGMLNAMLAIKTPVFAFIWIAVTMTSLLGALMMWQLMKAGFHIYFIAAVVAYLLPAIAEGAEMMTIQRLFFTSIFIFFYGLHLRFMR
jgi:hypothetical protein